MMTQLVTVRVHRPRERRIRFGIPVLPVLLVLSPLLLAAALALVVASVFYRVNPVRVLRAGWDLMAALRGLRVEVQQGRTEVRVNVT